jgi:tRNA threonylcarbamoyladenosine biosynthesis protein TsaE
MARTYVTKSPGETAAIGERLAESLEAGDVLLLRGELGSGKTCFTQGLARGLGVADPVKSSSFILLAEYQGRLRLYHADLYRLTTVEEVAELALGEQTADGVLVVEWPERAMRELPDDHLQIKFEHAGDSERRISFAAVGERYRDLLPAAEGAASN